MNCDKNIGVIVIGCGGDYAETFAAIERMKLLHDKVEVITIEQASQRGLTISDLPPPRPPIASVPQVYDLPFVNDGISDRAKRRKLERDLKKRK